MNHESSESTESVYWIMNRESWIKGLWIMNQSDLSPESRKSQNWIKVLSVTLTTAVRSNSSISAHCPQLHARDVRVICDPEPIEVRLTGGDTEHDGIVEVFKDNEWRSVCADQFDYNAPSV